MPNPIRALPPEVVGQIAAGEVVERPAAALKEMIENSMDAGASAVTVEIKDGGISYFRVTDNGSGIAPSDVRMAFERHATSKLQSAEQLSHIATLGFRGEALASIAAVARVTLKTRVSGAESGVMARVVGGVFEEITDCACPEGTSITVEDLFFNTPARLGFLKKPASEAAYVSDMVERMLLSSPKTAFRFINGGKQVYHSLGDGSLRSAAAVVYGRKTAGALLPVSGMAGGMIMEGLLGVGENCRASRREQSFYLNGRYVKSPLMSRALEVAVRERVMVGKFPMGVFMITVPYENVDVNVHPNKLEVRFRSEDAVFKSLMSMFASAIYESQKAEEPPKLVLSEPSETRVKRETRENAADNIKISTDIPVLPLETAETPETPLKSGFADSAQNDGRGDTAPPRPVTLPPIGVSAPSAKEAFSSMFAPAPVTLPPVYSTHEAMGESRNRSAPAPALLDIPAPKPRPKYKLIGTAFDTYILLEMDGRLLMIDQHAAHERMLYDRFMKAYDVKVISQRLLVSEIVALSSSEMARLEECLPLLNDAGYDIDVFGEREVKVNAVPQVLGKADNAAFLHEVIGKMDETRQLKSQEERRSAIIQTACKHAIKGGDVLSITEIEELVSSALSEETAPSCPHGRPVMIVLTRSELEKRFHRIQ
ncbi:MAG: DNA mismatch repair endonuclease MutL [Eubacteriales bacterium]|nr:DNA mismatch repair endonuclease MutL [Eubacteriales bacterium]MDD3882801.1 DNA mismatch repair endonuclease MutL [Eubacteriales bacterium]